MLLEKSIHNEEIVESFGQWNKKEKGNKICVHWEENVSHSGSMLG
jgi:hypothetical protein